MISTYPIYPIFDRLKSLFLIPSIVSAIFFSIKLLVWKNNYEINYKNNNFISLTKLYFFKFIYNYSTYNKYKITFLEVQM